MKFLLNECISARLTPLLADAGHDAVHVFRAGPHRDVDAHRTAELGAARTCLSGHKYAVVTALERAVPLIENRLVLAGLDVRCASVRASGL